MTISAGKTANIRGLKSDRQNRVNKFSSDTVTGQTDLQSSSSSGMLASERRAAGSLALIYSLRMFGLFIILPVFSLYADDYPSATPMLIGLALGIYGLLQALLQIPFGFLSDRFGRKPVIAAGFVLFAIGSVVAAMSTDIYGVIFGRALQGSGAVASAIMALASDLTREEQRTKMMASLGASIGMAFIASLILGPILVSWLGLSELFWLTGVAAVLGIVILYTLVPTPVAVRAGGDTRPRWDRMKALLQDDQLLRLDIGIFVLHMMVSATFLAVPISIAAAGVPGDEHWQLYLPALILSIVVMVPLIIAAEKFGYLRRVFMVAIAGLIISQLVFWFGSGRNDAVVLFVGIAVFFSFFNTMEAMLPSLVSKLAPVEGKGSAMGVYSTSQFLGAFVGGVFGGWLYTQYGAKGLYLGMAVIAGVWWVVARGMQKPHGYTTQLVKVGTVDSVQAIYLAKQYSELSGVQEAVVVAEEGIAYLRVDKKQFDRTSLDTVMTQGNG